MGAPPADPTWWPTGDVYRRDQLNWRANLEPSPGVYNFAAFEFMLSEAETKGGRAFGRVMPWMSPGDQPHAPTWIPTTASGAPDWNNTAYLTSWINLMTAIGDTYDSDPRLFSMDISGFGAWGEGYLEAGWGDPMTLANYSLIVDATIAAFPTTYLHTCAFNEPGFEYMGTAMSKSPRVGWRFDNAGGMQLSLAGNAGLENNWKTAPLAAEWGPRANHENDDPGQPLRNARVCLDNVRDLHIALLSSGNHITPYASMSPVEQAAYQTAYKIAGHRYTINSASMGATVAAGSTVTFTTSITNHGVAPAYDEWEVRVVLRNRSTNATWSAPLPNVNVRAVLGGGPSPYVQTFNTSLTVGATLLGDYEVSLTAVHGYLPPLQFAMADRTDDGRYVMGSVVVTI